MLFLRLSDFTVELKRGAIHNAGAPTTEATIKQYDIEEMSVEEFGDERLKLIFDDEDDNELQVALFPEEVEELESKIEDAKAESDLFD